MIYMHEIIFSGSIWYPLANLVVLKKKIDVLTISCHDMTWHDMTQCDTSLLVAKTLVLKHVITHTCLS